MEPVFVKAHFDLHCDWEGLPPSYRVYVNDELFAERTYIWTNEYLNEMLQISAPPGRYQVRVELIKPNLAKVSTENYTVSVGPGRWIEPGVLEIAHESQ